MTLGRAWRTLRHVRWEQVLCRGLFHVTWPTPNPSPAPQRRAIGGPWVRPAARAPNMVAQDAFVFLGETRSLASSGWDAAHVDLLWRYNLHYFDDLNAEGAGDRRAWHRALIERWICDNPPGRSTAWSPYPTSLRIANWIKAYRSGLTPEPVWLDNLAMQVRWLRDRIEWHVLGNHLFVNAKALILAGLFFRGPEAMGWLRQGVRIAHRELAEQFLGDGGQFERSPMYHALAFEDVLDLIQAGRAWNVEEPSWRRLRQRLEVLAPAMWRWLRVMAHPAGRLTYFNDAADGIAPPLHELERVAGALGVRAPQPLTAGCAELPESGYVRLAYGDWIAWLDVAPPGPDYLMAHAHADTLTFELSLHGRPILVNGGTSRYGTSEVRVTERGTAAHNTVTVAGLDSSEVWSGFRVGRRARVVAKEIDTHAVRAAHDGYAHLPGKPLHERTWHLTPAELCVHDRVSVSSYEAIARYHLAPGLRLLSAGPGVWQVADGTRILAEVRVDCGAATVEPATHSPRFGVVLPTEQLVVCLDEGRARTRWRAYDRPTD